MGATDTTELRSSNANARTVCCEQLPTLADHAGLRRSEPKPGASNLRNRHRPSTHAIEAPTPHFLKSPLHKRTLHSKRLPEEPPQYSTPEISSNPDATTKPVQSPLQTYPHTHLNVHIPPNTHTHTHITFAYHSLR